MVLFCAWTLLRKLSQIFSVFVGEFGFLSIKPRKNQTFGTEKSGKESAESMTVVRFVRSYKKL